MKTKGANGGVITHLFVVDLKEDAVGLSFDDPNDRRGIVVGAINFERR